MGFGNRKQKWFRRLLAAVVLFCFVVQAAGCGNSSTSTTSDSDSIFAKSDSEAESTSSRSSSEDTDPSSRQEALSSAASSQETNSSDSDVSSDDSAISGTSGSPYVAEAGSSEDNPLLTSFDVIYSDAEESYEWTLDGSTLSLMGMADQDYMLLSSNREILLMEELIANDVMTDPSVFNFAFCPQILSGEIARVEADSYSAVFDVEDGRLVHTALYTTYTHDAEVAYYYDYDEYGRLTTIELWDSEETTADDHGAYRNTINYQFAYDEGGHLIECWLSHGDGWIGSGNTYAYHYEYDSEGLLAAGYSTYDFGVDGNKDTKYVYEIDEEGRLSAVSAGFYFGSAEPDVTVEKVYACNDAGQLIQVWFPNAEEGYPISYTFSYEENSNDGPTDTAYTGLYPSYADLIWEWADYLGSNGVWGNSSGTPFDDCYEVDVHFQNASSVEATFSLDDLNGDVVYELLLGMYRDGTNGIHDIYTWDPDADRVVQLTPAHIGGITLFLDKCLYATEGKGSQSYTFYQYEGGDTLTELERYDYSYYEGSSERVLARIVNESGDYEMATEEELTASEESHGGVDYWFYPATGENAEKVRSFDLDALDGGMEQRG